MPIDYRDYHPDWRWISRQIRKQAGDVCELCGVANGATGARDRFGEWHAENMIHGMNYDVGYDLFSGEFPAMIRIVLTVAHMNHDRDDNDPSNLRALCQKCHLNHDREQHRAKAAATLRRKWEERIAARGQLALIGAER